MLNTQPTASLGTTTLERARFSPAGAGQRPPSAATQACRPQHPPPERRLLAARNRSETVHPSCDQHTDRFRSAHGHHPRQYQSHQPAPAHHPNQPPACSPTHSPNGRPLRLPTPGNKHVIQWTQNSSKLKGGDITFPRVGTKLTFRSTNGQRSNALNASRADALNTWRCLPMPKCEHSPFGSRSAAPRFTASQH